jgi:hypothetical protein
LASSSAWSARFKQGVSGSSPEREVAAPNVTLTQHPRRRVRGVRRCSSTRPAPDRPPKPAG